MSNSLFNQLQNSKSQTTNSQMSNPMQLLQSLRQNPVEVLRQRGFSVPDGMTNPNQIIQHLMSSGQINQNRLAQAQQMAMGFKR